MKKKQYAYISVVIFLLVLIFSTFNIMLWLNDQKSLKKINDNIKDITISKEIPQEIKTDDYLINPPSNKDDDYWNYTDVSFLQVDFDKLIAKNNDTVAWIKLPNTKIDYPVVQAKDNKYYLTHTFDKSTNKAGWIFLDYRNNLDELDYNNVIYGHNRLDKTMFGSLKNVLKDDWYNDKDNHIIKLSTPKYDTVWQIFSIYTIYKESYYINVAFDNLKDYDQFLDTIYKRSLYKFNTTVNNKDHILTLSTCKDSNGNRLVVHAKLIKKKDH